MTNILPAINGLHIRQRDGLFSLNDLHRASGGEARHQPNQFTRRDETRALVAEIEQAADSQLALKSVHGGRDKGTYACRELVVAYAAWISPAFHLKVLRAFLGSAGGGGQNVPSPSLRIEQPPLALPAPDTAPAAAEAPAQPFDWLDRHALDAARRSAQQWEQSVLRRPYSTTSSPQDAIPDEDLRGLLARSLRGQRFIISLSVAPAGGWLISPVPQNAALVDFEHDAASTIAEALPRRRVGELIAALAARLA